MTCNHKLPSLWGDIRVSTNPGRRIHGEAIAQIDARLNYCGSGLIYAVLGTSIACVSTDYCTFLESARSASQSTVALVAALARLEFLRNYDASKT